jgi:hypothetical protein
MMDKLITEVKELVEKEYGRAAAKFGCTNNSDHESYAVLLEEMDEGMDDIKIVNQRIQLFWNSVKSNLSDEYKFSTCRGIEQAAVLAACELIQVAAMAKKAAMTVGDRNVVVDLTTMAGESE